MTVRIGVIGEGRSDCESVKAIVLSARRDTTVELRAAGGSGNIVRRGEALIGALHIAGCASVVVVHDLDSAEEHTLRARLLSVHCQIRRLICIPMQELEAWFWADPAIVREVGRGRGKAVVSPHLVKDPKEKLKLLSMGPSGKARYSVNDNPRLAQKLDHTICAQRCLAFRQLLDFVRAS